MPSVALAAALVALAVPALPASAAPLTQRDVIDGSYIVVFKRSAGSVSGETTTRERRLGFKSRHRYRRAVEGFSARLSPGQVRRLRSDPEVAYVSQNRRVSATVPVALLGNDSAPSGVRRILAGSATTARQASGTNVAVIDTGIDLTHPDLNAVDGTNCISPGSPADDDDGHGTHVAGSIGATNDGAGIVGVAPGTKTYAVKVLDANGRGTAASVVCGIDWVTANHAALGIDVVNMSLGGIGEPVTSCASTTDPEHDAICSSTAAGVNYVVAAGNSGWDFDFASEPDTPAAYPQVLTVSAISDSDGSPGGAGPAPSCEPSESDDTPASFSNFALTAAGRAHTIAAPGTCITSTWNDGGYNTISGTSMASPHMAGVVALCMDEGGVSGPCSTRTPAQVISYLRAQAQTHNTANPGYGFTGDPNSPGAGFYGFLTGPFAKPESTPIASGASGSTGATSPSGGGGSPAAPGRASSHGAKSFKRLRRGRFTYRFRAGAGLRGSASFASIGKVKVSARRKVTLARKSFTVPAGGKVTLRIKLSKRSLRILRRNRKIKLRVTVRLRNAAGLTSTATSTLSLRI